MGDRWGPEGPPDEAYSRVSRDLEAVTAAFAAHLDRLRDKLLARFECRVRPATAAELERLGHATHDREEVDAYAVEPADPGSATLLVDRYVWEGGTSVSLAAGRSAASGAPGCFCDACDEDSDEMIRMGAVAGSPPAPGRSSPPSTGRPGSVIQPLQLPG